MQRQRLETLPDGNIRLTIPYVITKRGNGRRIITPEGDEPVGDTQREAMLFAFARARRWQRLIDEGKFANIKELATAIGKDPSQIARAIRLTRLSPAIVHRIIVGDTPDGISLARLRGDLPVKWSEQEEMLMGTNK